MITGRDHLGTVWPEVSERVCAMLQKRGIDRDTAEDACHEAVVRLLAREVPFTDAGDLLRWMRVVAWNLAIDGARRQRRIVHDLPDGAAHDNTEREVVGRLALGAVARSWGELSAAERDVLVSADAPDGVSARTNAVRRHRARAHLRAMVEGALGALGWVRLRLRRPAIRLALVTAALVGPTMVVTLPHHRDASGPPAVSLTTGHPDAGLPAARGATPATGHSASADTAPRVPAREVAPAVRVPVPAIPEAEVWGRPKEEDDGVLCVDTVPFGVKCVRLPIRVTR